MATTNRMIGRMETITLAGTSLSSGAIFDGVSITRAQNIGVTSAFSVTASY